MQQAMKATGMEDAPNITGVWEGESIWNAAINTAD
jgi:hypothetical protein